MSEQEFQRHIRQVEFKSDGYDEAYTRYLERSLKHERTFKWWAFAGWVITAILFWLAMEGAL